MDVPICTLVEVPGALDGYGENQVHVREGGGGGGVERKLPLTLSLSKRKGIHYTKETPLVGAKFQERI